MVQEQSAKPGSRAPVAEVPAEERSSSQDEDSSKSRAVLAPAGMHDVLWPESSRWEALVATFAGLARLSAFGLLVTPVVEEARLFSRAVGPQSEVVGKEMYEFDDRAGRRLALRPEGTAPVVRAFLQHHPPVPWKVWYFTPAFRYERPQAGRYREHHQLGVEALGTDDPDIDVEVIALASAFYRALGLRKVELLLNSMGCADDRPRYVDTLRRYLEQHKDQLCDEHRERFSLNPLRVLDCKTEQCKAATEDAPMMLDHLDESCRVHFERVREGLGALDVACRIEPRLVRGLDYYTRTTFEFSSGALEGAQNAVGGGGRYDGLAEAIGGPPTPGIGFGMGVERLLLACGAEGCFEAAPPAPDVFVVDSTGGSAARDLTASLRAAGVVALRAYDARSLKAQMKLADRSGARFAAIVGPRELEGGTVTVRDLRSGGEDTRGDPVVARERLVEHLRKGGGERGGAE